MQEICNKYRVKQVSERSYPTNVIEKTTDEFINLPTGSDKSLIYQALPLVCDTVRGTTGNVVVVSPPGKSYERSSYKSWKILVFLL